MHSRMNLTRSEIQVPVETEYHWWQVGRDLIPRNILLTLQVDDDICGRISPRVYAIKSNNTTQRQSIVSGMRGCYAYGCSGSSRVVL